MKPILSLFLIGATLMSCGKDDGGNTPTDDLSTSDDTLMETFTAIGDVNFEEALVALGIDDEVDGQIADLVAESIATLTISGNEISSLEGIEAFANLTALSASSNNLSSVDLSQNRDLTVVDLTNNSLTSFSLQGLIGLESLTLTNNLISEIEVNATPSLETLFIKNNLLEGISVSALSNLIVFSTIDNPTLDCIEVSQDQLESIPSEWSKDLETMYAIECL